MQVDDRVNDLVTAIMTNESDLPALLTAREGGGDSPGHGSAIPRLGLPEYDWGVNW
jgi:hypothetical protein